MYTFTYLLKSVFNGHVHRVYFFELNIETKKGKMILAHHVDLNKKIVKQKLKQNKTFDLLPILSDPPENIQTWDVSCEY